VESLGGGWGGLASRSAGLVFFEGLNDIFKKNLETKKGPKSILKISFSTSS